MSISPAMTGLFFGSVRIVYFVCADYKFFERRDKGALHFPFSELAAFDSFYMHMCTCWNAFTSSAAHRRVA